MSKIDKLISRLEQQANRVARFSHVANGTKQLSEEMLKTIEKLKYEVGVLGES